LWSDEEVEQTVHMISKHMPEGEKLLEIGCGSFKHGARLSSAGFKVIGLDFTVEQLTNAPPGSSLLCADARSIPMASSSLGGVVAVMVLHQVTEGDRPLVTTEIQRVLRPGGRLIIKTCTHDDLRKRPLSQWFPSSLTINLARFPSDAQVKTLLYESGLHVKRVWSTQSYSAFPTESFLQMLATRPSSSLQLIPEDEYSSGLKRFRSEHADHSLVRLDHYHTFYLACRR
jgi:ubiquinone/menaquinone biosynthesis C-methylase UbiE